MLGRFGRTSYFAKFQDFNPARLVMAARGRRALVSKHVDQNTNYIVTEILLAVATQAADNIRYFLQ
jgi:hypothetical protein